MSLTATAIRLMADKGLSAHDIAEIAEACEPKVDSAAEKRRAYDRERKREEREAKRIDARKSGGKSGGNPPDPAPPNDNNLTPSPVPPVISDEMTSPELKPEHVVEAWNDMAEPLGLPTVRKLTPERRRKLGTRIRSSTIADFTEAIAAVPRSPFLRGENDRHWKADFDWMLEPRNFTKLIEGTYDR